MHVTYFPHKLNSTAILIQSYIVYKNVKLHIHRNASVKIRKFVLHFPILSFATHKEGKFRHYLMLYLMVLWDGKNREDIIACSSKYVFRVSFQAIVNRKFRFNGALFLRPFMWMWFVSKSITLDLAEAYEQMSRF